MGQLWRRPSIPVPQECIDRSSVGYSNYLYPHYKNLWQGDTKDSTKGGEGSAQKDGAGVEHKYNFQLLYYELD
ncbi:hypothetical protein MKX03_022646 [Papaver bracteatum]|nr:hypothetical protein MKX03_022646 [Papaver bracteatum]